MHDREQAVPCNRCSVAFCYSAVLPLALLRGMSHAVVFVSVLRCSLAVVMSTWHCRARQAGSKLLTCGLENFSEVSRNLHEVDRRSEAAQAPHVKVLRGQALLHKVSPFHY